MAVLEELQEAVDRVSAVAGPSVVGVGNGWVRGSGIVVADGKVLTNAHNLRGDGCTVTFGDGRSASARVAGADIDGDIAVLDVDTAGAGEIAWADADAAPKVGTPVFAIGNPGGRELRVTFGLVSGSAREFRGPRGRRISGSIEHTAPLRPGSSGGPVLDRDGKLLGVNTNRLGDGFYLAIPADGALRRRVEALGRGESAARPRIGIAIAPAEVARRMRRAVGLPERDGLLVRGVEDGGPAASAGIQEGDLVVEAAGRVVSTADDLQDVLAALDPGVSIELRLVRGAEERSVTVTPAID